MANKTRELMKLHSTDVQNLATELLQKETLDLLDIIRILGERPFALSDNMKDYMKEIEMRKKDKANKSKDEEKKEKDDKEHKEDQKDDKKDDKDKEGGARPAPKNQQEREIQEAETIMK